MRPRITCRGTSSHTVEIRAIGFEPEAIDGHGEAGVLRSEAAMSEILRESHCREDDSRSLLRDLFRTSADMLPDCDRSGLTVRLHTLSTPRFSRG